MNEPKDLWEGAHQTLSLCIVALEAQLTSFEARLFDLEKSRDAELRWPQVPRIYERLDTLEVRLRRLLDDLKLRLDELEAKGSIGDARTQRGTFAFTKPRYDDDFRAAMEKLDDDERLG